jgi:hypothetical protein
MVPAGIGFCCKHVGAAPVVIEGQGFICGYMGCTAITSVQEHCSDCKSLQGKDVDMQEVPAAGAGGGAAASTTPDGSVESSHNAASAAVKPDDCEHCLVEPADGDSKYCKDCIAKLEKELGLVDEEDDKEADCAGGRSGGRVGSVHIVFGA